MCFPEVSHSLQKACCGTKERGMDVRQWMESPLLVLGQDGPCSRRPPGPVQSGKTEMCGQRVRSSDPARTLDGASG